MRSNISSLNDSIVVFRNLYNSDMQVDSEARRNLKKYIGELKYAKRMARRRK